MIDLTPIEEHSYSFMDGFFIQMPMSEHGMRQVDWDKVKELMDSGEYSQIDVGLAEDWECTFATVFDSMPVFDEYASFYGCSRWATPAVKLYSGCKEIGLFECWVSGEQAHAPQWITEYAKNYEDDEDDTI